MTKTVVARWVGGLRLDAASSLGGHVAMEGDDDVPGFRPSELLLAALAGCTAMDVVSILRKKRLDLATYEVSVIGEQRSAHPVCFTQVTVEHVFGGADLDQAALRRAIELSATRYCPVTAHLSSGDLRVSHRYRLAGPLSDGDIAESVEVVVTGPHGAGLALPG